MTRRTLEGPELIDLYVEQFRAMWKKQGEARMWALEYARQDYRGERANWLAVAERLK